MSGGNAGVTVGQGLGCSPTRAEFLELQGRVLRILLWLLFEAAVPVPCGVDGLPGGQRAGREY